MLSDKEKYELRCVEDDTKGAILNYLLSEMNQMEDRLTFDEIRVFRHVILLISWVENGELDKFRANPII